ncbi:swr1 complex component [Loxospora ochrophaea]|nr:swr1 complex component [Loxospora ochrophaea]
MNGEHHVNNQRGTPGEIGVSTPTASLLNVSTESPVNYENFKVEDNASEDLPPAKKRKLSDLVPQHRSTSRPVSPPWKRIAVDGPASFVEGGRRKSSRTNVVPLELQPHSDKRQTRAAIQKPPVTKSKYGGAAVYNSSPLGLRQASTQTNGKRPHSSGKAATGQVANKSPAKTQYQNGSSSALNGSSESPIKRHPYKRRNKLAASDTPVTSNKPSNSHQPRRSGRPPKPIVTKNDPQLLGASGWHGSDKEEKGGCADEDDTDDDTEEAEVEIDPKFKPQRLKFKVRMPTVTIQHPGNVLPVRKFPSFRDWLEHNDQSVGNEKAEKGILSDREAREEARMRQRILDAAQPDGLLSEEKCSLYIPDPQEEPSQQYAHQDHLVAHAIYFRKLMNKEQRDHMNAARRIANAAAAEWKRRQPKTNEDIRKEQEEATITCYKQLFKDLMQKWDNVRAEVGRRRLKMWEEEQQVLGKQALNKVLEQSTQLLDKRRRRGSSVDNSGEDDESEEGSEIGGSNGSGSEEGTEDESNMSSSQSESEDDPHAATEQADEELTIEELRRKYAELPEEGLDRPPDKVEEAYDQQIVEQNSASMDHGPASDLNGEEEILLEDGDEQMLSQVSLEEVDDTLLDESDQSTDMEDDIGSSDEDSESGGEESQDAIESSDEGQGLLGFFSKRELQLAENNETPETKLTNGIDESFEEEIEEVSLVPDATQVQTPSASNSEEPLPEVRKEMELVTTLEHQIPDAARGPSSVSCSIEPKTKPSLFSKTSNLDSPADTPGEYLPTTPLSSHALKTPVPSLLRGSLREYQHFGLDWLAGLYASGTNGILADEMGLGKTIQTIALLAHLAVEHEVWGPHLIVVPTSVMLNWEMEFKKFLPGFKILTYYGTQEERKQKRKGWLDNDKWHVCITSYQLVLQDQQTFKRRGWHYMVLDEAHNIKNFRSQRWQTLLTFRTRARLLLTGTPLQNNLTELWSLLFFLMPSDSTETGIAAFAGLEAFTNWFRKPTDQILEHGRETMDDEAKALVKRLHELLRPYLLRRLKADVEKQMPAKYEHVVYCKLSKRQRYLYDGFMSRAQTRETLAHGNYLSIINCLMQLRKVCNHPDLFETRQIVTSFAMPKSAVADYEIKELLVRRRLLQDDPMDKVDLNVVNLCPGANGPVSALDTIQTCRLGALGRFRHMSSLQSGRMIPNMVLDGSSVESSLAHLDNTSRMAVFDRYRQYSYLMSLRSQRRPLMSYGLIERLTMNLKQLPHPQAPKHKAQLADWWSNMSPAVEHIVLTLSQRSRAMEPAIRKFACVTPAVVTPDITPLALTRPGVEVVREAQELCPTDAFHEARMRLSIAFPDKRLLQYDCGKLQRLDALLRTLQAGGHRALIFTQMTKVLDILEQFLNIHGHRYLRLDGATKIEQRQILTDRFNNDNRILAFILSSRSGGLGINLTGADTVIFYDLDWNPAMDKQCQDRCHRIGQTRDVHIYRFVSEYTIEANILRKANQKRMLDDVVIQEGEFTTDFFHKVNAKDALTDESLMNEGDAEASAAMDRVLGTGPTGNARMAEKVFEQVEDKEDIAAAREAEKEMVYADAEDFDDKTGSAGRATPKTPGPQTPREKMLQSDASIAGGQTTDAVEHVTTLDAAQSGLVVPGVEDVGGAGGDVEDEEGGHIDEQMIRFLEWELRHEPIMGGAEGKKKGRGRKKSKVGVGVGMADGHRPGRKKKKKKKK